MPSTNCSALMNPHSNSNKAQVVSSIVFSCICRFSILALMRSLFRIPSDGLHEFIDEHIVAESESSTHQETLGRCLALNVWMLEFILIGFQSTRSLNDDDNFTFLTFSPLPHPAKHACSGLTRFGSLAMESYSELRCQIFRSWH